MMNWAYEPVFIPEMSHARILIVPYGLGRVWNTLRSPVRDPYDARAGTTRAPL